MSSHHPRPRPPQATLVPTVYLWGSAAMGKSTLLAALQARWAAFPVFGVRCAEPEELQAFIAVRHLLGAIFAWLKSCPAFPGHLPAHRVQVCGWRVLRVRIMDADRCWRFGSFGNVLWTALCLHCLPIF